VSTPDSSPSKARARPSPNVLRAVAIMGVLLVLGALVGLFVGHTQAAVYQASDQALIEVWSVDSLVLTGQSSDLTSDDESDAATIVTSRAVLDVAVANLRENGLTADDLRTDITATPSTTSHFVTIAVTGSSSAQASSRLSAVGKAFVKVARNKVLAAATRLAALPDSQLGSSGSAASTIKTRASLVAKTVQPVVLYPAGAPKRVGAGVTSSVIAGAIVGLALGALLVVALSFSSPKVATAQGAFTQLGLPGLDWRVGSGPVGSDQAADLAVIAGADLVAVCAAGPDDEAAAQDVYLWLSEHSAQPAGSAQRLGPLATADAATGRVAGRSRSARSDTHPATPRVIKMRSPASGMAVARPDAADVDALLLVCASGHRTADVERAADALTQWRHIDAIVVAAPAR
jgi:capsular polysaccharide biosynthesis protein